MAKAKNKSLKVTESSWYGFFFKLLESVPVIVPVALCGFGIVAISLLLIGKLYTGLVLLLGSAVAILMSIVVLRNGDTKRPGTTIEKRIFDILILVFVLSWIFINIPYTSEHVYTDRDPATYNITAVHIIDSPDVFFATYPEFSGLENVTEESPGFAKPTPGANVLHSQGLHLLSAFLGLLGRFFGASKMMHLNLIFGGAALLAVYGYARLLAKPKWAFISTVTLGVALPMIYFSRDIYTEPLTMVFAFGALSLTWIAYSTRKLRIWFIAGLLAGAGMLTRIDSLILVVGFVIYLVIYLISKSDAKEQRYALREVGLFQLGMVLTTIIGWLDLTTLSRQYYENHSSLILYELWLLVFVLLLGAVSVVITWNLNQTIKNRLSKITDGEVIAIFILLIAMIFISRPLWYTSFTSEQNVFVEGIQKARGFPIEPRDYAEITTQWIGWYIGPIMAWFGVIGMSIAAGRTLSNKNLKYTAGLLVVILASFVYLIKPNVAADQIWASRRLLPIILPGLIVFGAITISALMDRVKDLRHRGIFFSLLSAAVVINPLLTTRPFINTKESARLVGVSEVCNKLPNDSVVFWVAQARYELVQPTREFCKKPAAGITRIQPSKSSLMSIAQKMHAQNKIPIIGIYGEHSSHIAADFKTTELSEAVNYKYIELEKSLVRPPQHVVEKQHSILLGIINIDGTITSLSNKQ